MNECLTVIFGLPRGLLFVWKVEINLVSTHLQGIRITFPINMSLLFEITFSTVSIFLNFSLT